MHTKDDKAYATLTDVKNKTGDVFALADEFGEVTITSYNKSKYIIKRLLITKAEMNQSVESELIEPAAAEVPVAEELPALPETQVPIVEAADVQPEVPAIQLSEVVLPIETPVIPVVEELPQQPAVTMEELPPMAVEAPAITTPVAAIVETVISSSIPAVAAPEPVTIAPLPPEPAQQTQTPAIEIFTSSAPMPSHMTHNDDHIVGVFAGVGLDNIWDRSNRQELAWVREIHQLL